MEHGLAQKAVRAAFLISALLFGFFVYSLTGQAINITTYSDTLSTSAPELYANHTIDFTIGSAIPAGGWITITPEAGSFTVATSSFDADNVELYVNTGAGYSSRLATTTATLVYDGIAITSGSSGNVTYTLNDTTGIPSGARLRMLIGDHTTNATTSDVGIQNPSATGTFPIAIRYGGGTGGDARALVAIVEQVGVGPVDTTEDIPPVRFNGAPSGELSGTISAAEVSLETDEFSTCRYSTTAGIAYSAMGLQFSNTGSVFHSFTVTGLTNDTTYTYYVRCTDDEGNENTDDYTIQFTIPVAPEGEPGEGDENSGGEDDGSGSGSTGGGGGSSSGDNDSSESGSGGSSGGGSGGGGTNSSDLPYESGDGRVVINGYAFPNSTVTILVDGTSALTERANSSGQFTATIDEIARGVYTFGVYATDSQDVKSSTFTTTFTVTGARGSTLSNVNLMPTIQVSPDPVQPGQTLTFSGYAIPDSAVEIETRREGSGGSVTSLTATSNGSGFWSTTVDTSGFARDTWKVRARSTQPDGGRSTNFSQYTFYGVGAEAQEPTSTSDLNRDGRVNLIDFSILLFHWNTAGGSSDPPADINRDGRVSLTDFSIMIFNWSG